MSDASAHLPCANNTDFCDFHLGFSSVSQLKEAETYSLDRRSASAFRNREMSRRVAAERSAIRPSPGAVDADVW
jgi:hypothetical protein